MKTRVESKESDLDSNGEVTVIVTPGKCPGKCDHTDQTNVITPTKIECPDKCDHTDQANVITPTKIECPGK